jgi:monofunctional biosynthetic peptidoglycan transglycosylase
MAKKTTLTEYLEDREAEATPRLARVRQSLLVFRRWLLRTILACAVIFAGWGLAYRWLNPPTTLYMMQESWRLDGVQYDWVNIEDVSPFMVRALVAAEDANFCAHWGIDSAAVRQALRDGAMRGGSTISQQTVKNVFLWQGRSWLRKAIEALMTPYAEMVWSKKRFLEIYINVAEFDTGVFGIQAAARHHFGVDAAQLNRVQAGRLAVVLPDPKGRSATEPGAGLKKHAASVIAGSDMIAADGRAACFED